MPIMDAQLLFSEAQDITADSGNSVVSEDVVLIPQVKDHTETARNDRINQAGKLYFNVVVEDVDLLAAVDGAVVTIALMNDTDSVPTTGGDTIITKDITVNTLAANYVDGTLIMSVPLPAQTYKPYFGVLYSVATQNLSAGSVTAWIGGQVQAGGEHGAL
ncbi:MAG: hypothetical protein PF495_13565 [Spirochaetales bacterium]|jgi:hypothetical protein|nr:hypothetical protein [Spirochaetales bacterium]